MVDFLNDEVDAVRGRVLVDGGWRAGVLSAAEKAGGGLERVSVLDAGSPEGPKRKRFPLVRECESALVPLLHGAA